MATVSAVTPKRFTIEDYHRLIELGFLTENDRVELVRGELMQMVWSHPSPSDISLVAEVADSTLKYDQEVKLPLYAESGISNYWIFNLVASCLEIYTQPYQDLQGNFGYANKQVFLPNTVVTLPGFPELSLDLSRVFPGYDMND